MLICGLTLEPVRVSFGRHQFSAQKNKKCWGLHKFTVKISNDCPQINTLKRKCLFPIYFYKITNSFDLHCIPSHAKEHDAQQIWTTDMFTLCLLASRCLSFMCQTTSSSFKILLLNFQSPLPFYIMFSGRVITPFERHVSGVLTGCFQLKMQLCSYKQKAFKHLVVKRIQMITVAC